MVRATLCAAAVFSLAAAGCKSNVSLKGELPPRLRASLIAVYPFGFRWQEPAYRSFELSQRLLVDVVLPRADYHALVYGPSEFQIWRPDDENVFAATTLGRLLPPLQLRPRQVVVLKPWAEKRIHTSTRTLVNHKGKAVGAEQQEEARYVGHVEVLHPASGTRLLEVSGEAEVDPFAERHDEGADPSPELTALMLELVAQAMEQLGPHLSAPGHPQAPSELTWALSPQFAFGYEEPGRPHLAQELARMDALDRELFVSARARYANPGLPEASLAPLQALPAGLLIQGAPAGAPLGPGDLLVRVNGEPALPQAVWRARLRPGPDLLRVRRASGDYEEAHWAQP